MVKFDNSLKTAFLNSVPIVSIENKDDKLTERCKFNFSYMDYSQSAGHTFEQWSDLTKLMEKIKSYCKEPLEYWTKQSIGHGGRKILEIYGNFPANSDFVHPRHVPIEAQWGRFRLNNDERLAGFILPEACHGQIHGGTGLFFDCNVFYVVFLDPNHGFYKTMS